jgi:hypothetical protein
MFISHPLLLYNLVQVCPKHTVLRSLVQKVWNVADILDFSLLDYSNITILFSMNFLRLDIMHDNKRMSHEARMKTYGRFCRPRNPCVSPAVAQNSPLLPSPKSYSQTLLSWLCMSMPNNMLWCHHYAQLGYVKILCSLYISIDMYIEQNATAAILDVTLTLFSFPVIHPSDTKCIDHCSRIQSNNKRKCLVMYA